MSRAIVAPQNAVGHVRVAVAGVVHPAADPPDGVVDVQDLIVVLATWGQAGGAGDVDGSGTVDVLDLIALVVAWGPC